MSARAQAAVARGAYRRSARGRVAIVGIADHGASEPRDRAGGRAALRACCRGARDIGRTSGARREADQGRVTVEEEAHEIGSQLAVSAGGRAGDARRQRGPTRRGPEGHHQDTITSRRRSADAGTFAGARPQTRAPVSCRTRSIARSDCSSLKLDARGIRLGVTCRRGLPMLMADPDQLQR